MTSSIPDDATGQAIKRWAAEGSDLTRPMKIDFFVAVPTELSSQQVGWRAQALGFSVSLEDDSETGTWTCYCAKVLVPDHAAIVKIERQLDVIAKEYGGHADGFGSYGNSPKM